MFFWRTRSLNSILTMQNKRTLLPKQIIFAFLVFTCTNAAIGSLNGKEVVVINGSNVFSFKSTEFDLSRTLYLEDENAVHLFVDEYPVFFYPDGLRNFVESNVAYPEQAIINNAEGVVLINFIVEKDGSVSNPRILRAVGYGCDEEVLRLFTSFPKAIPGRIAGQPVRVGMTLPVRFRLNY